ncbi:hypothetical protein [uncultured Microscilla sp.]|uniref:hypothetical protein n=1 Tax=uncultured Microscilla sp. TaxID=432653 RepID=UPI002603A5A5|nr:hypothetical protein [uncultured Microscilla sp.]
MKIQLSSITFFALWLTVLVACTKQPMPDPETPVSNKTVVGTIEYTGMVAADGCGYIIRTDDGQVLKPLNLSTNFQQHGTNVVVTYNLGSESFSCGLLPTILTTINIINIRRI